jgi:phthalate 4,5-dioxygenase
MPLTSEENELMCRVGPGAPMGNMLREYWWPVLRSQKLVADGAPELVRLLGEDYVAFRDTDGRIGLLDSGCPHRHAPMVLARNEGCGLRCLMHGWKVDVDGKVLETPNESFSHPERIKTRHWPVREAGGMVWAWVGEGEPTPFPDLAFAGCPSETHVLPVMAKFRCNWVQLMETLWDPAHVGILHGTGDTVKKAWEDARTTSSEVIRDGDNPYMIGECRTAEMPWGFMYHFAQLGGPSARGWVPTVMPCWIFIGAHGDTPESDRLVFGHVPIDDENTILWQIAYNPSQPLGPIGQIMVKSAENPDDWRPEGMNAENRWGQDRESMANGSYTGIGEGHGITGVLMQDVAIAEGMGPVVDRRFENLGPADRAIQRGRRMLLGAVRAHMAGEAALGAREDVSNVGRAGGVEDDLELGAAAAS